MLFENRGFGYVDGENIALEGVRSMPGYFDKSKLGVILPLDLRCVTSEEEGASRKTSNGVYLRPLYIFGPDTKQIARGSFLDDIEGINGGVKVDKFLAVPLEMMHYEHNGIGNPHGTIEVTLGMNGDQEGPRIEVTGFNGNRTVIRPTHSPIVDRLIEINGERSVGVGRLHSEPILNSNIQYVNDTSSIASRQHCTLSRVDIGGKPCLLVEDCSKNGTFVTIPRSPFAVF